MHPAHAVICAELLQASFLSVLRAYDTYLDFRVNSCASAVIKSFDDLDLGALLEQDLFESRLETS